MLMRHPKKKQGANHIIVGTGSVRLTVLFQLFRTYAMKEKRISDAQKIRKKRRVWVRMGLSKDPRETE